VARDDLVACDVVADATIVAAGRDGGFFVEEFGQVVRSKREKRANYAVFAAVTAGKDRVLVE